ncbi:MAG: hypothetical protein ACT4TC_07655, partial [Myxococcaceae bacterium]
MARFKVVLLLALVAGCVRAPNEGRAVEINHGEEVLKALCVPCKPEGSEAVFWAAVDAPVAEEKLEALMRAPQNEAEWFVSHQYHAAVSRLVRKVRLGAFAASKDLEHELPVVRITALQYISTAGDAQFAPLTRKLLSSKEPSLILAAIHASLSLKDRAAIPELARLSGEADSLVAATAKYAHCVLNSGTECRRPGESIKKMFGERPRQDSDAACRELTSVLEGDDDKR